jgi:hypothetical protein
MSEKCNICQRDDEHNHGVIHYDPVTALYDKAVELLSEDIWDYESMNARTIAYISALPESYHTYGEDGIRTQVLYIVSNLKATTDKQKQAKKQLLSIGNRSSK